VTVYPDETLDDAVRQFGAMDVGRIPVVERRNPRRLLGVLRRGDIIHAYSHALLDSHQQSARLERLNLESTIGAELTELNVNLDDSAANKPLKEISIPPNSVIISIRRGQEILIPRGGTLLRAGDRVLFLARGVDRQGLRDALRGDPGSERANGGTAS
jgi:NhaP-type Na+/H+ and K+/H+ antiporter